MMQAFINDRFLAEEQGLIHFRDLAIMRGYGIFDFFRLIGNSPLFLDEHLNRFYESAEQMRLPVGKNKHELKDIISSLLDTNNLPDSGVRLTLTGGYSEDGYSIAEPNLVISQHSFKPLTGEQRSSGIKLMTFPHQRQLPQVKTIDYLMPIWLQPLIKQGNADDVLYYDKENVTECPRSNFFIITEHNKLLTPAMNILKGITRMKLLQYAAPYFEVQETNVSLEDIRNSKESFVTSTTKGILPVSQVDDKIFSSRTATSKLQEIWSKHAW